MKRLPLKLKWFPVGGADMRKSIAVLLCLLPALVSQSAGATNYHVYRKFEAVCHDNQLKRCSHHRCTSAPMELTQDVSPDCQRSLESRIFGAIVFAGLIDPASDRQSGPSRLSRVAQADTAKPNVPEVPSAKKSAPAPAPAAIAKWQKTLLTHLGRYKRYPGQGNGAEGVVSLAFTIDRKGNVVSSRVEKSSGSSVLDDEALAMIKRAAPLPVPPPEVADADLTFVLPIRFAPGEKR
jgi:TonB family protein